MTYSFSFFSSIDQMKSLSREVLRDLYKINELDLEVHYTKNEFLGDLSVTIFPLAKILKKNLAQIGKEFGECLLKKVDFLESFEFIKGFLNFQLKNSFYFKLIDKMNKEDAFEMKSTRPMTLMVEYSSPNTNKPLHLGHIRNNLLGASLSELFKLTGHKVIKAQIINDRGIHICKSMVAWQKFGVGATPKSTLQKGDHFVGKYYVLFDKVLKEEIKNLISQGYNEKEAQNEAPIMKEARELLKKWEINDEQTHKLWKEMNDWVYEGFNKTYHSLGIDFDEIQYESQTYLLGKKIVEEGLKKEIFYKKEDGSIWIDLKAEGLDKKLLLRSDGTSLYITQDLGAVVERFEKHPIEKLIYIVGSEQEYHFEVLFCILKKMGYKWAENLYHLSYGMVDLPSGRMKSREGTVVDADELIEQMHEKAKETTSELGKLENFSTSEKEKLFETIGLGALKYYLLKVDPKKRILFDPVASIDFRGNTGPYIQYTYARIYSLKRKAKELNLNLNRSLTEIELSNQEKELIKNLESYFYVINQATQELNLAKLANYAYELAKSFNDFYQNISVLNAQDDNQKIVRLNLVLITAKILKKLMTILGVELPTQM